MNFEQIMIRLGIDGTAIKSGLTRVGALVRAWGASIVNGFREYFTGITKGFLGAELAAKAFESLGKIKDRILTIAHLARTTGANTNFIQSIMLESQSAGIEIEKLDFAISTFNKTLGAAKTGSPEAIRLLSDFGVISDKSQIKTLTFAGAMHNLSVSFEKLHDKQKQAYMMQQLFGRRYSEMIPIIERGTAAIDAMSRGSFFTKISESSIQDFSDLWRSIKKDSQSAMATSVNFLDLLGQVLHAVDITDSQLKPKQAEAIDEKIKHQQDLQAMAEQQGISIAEMKNKVLEERSSLLERQAELTSQIADREKLSVNEMEERTRRLTGIKSPLELMRIITPRMMTALKIRTLEEQASVEFLKGDDAQMQKLQSEADQIRAANPWMKRLDVNPMARTESELERVNEHLEPVQRMAELVTSESK